MKDRMKKSAVAGRGEGTRRNKSKAGNTARARRSDSTPMTLKNEYMKFLVEVKSDKKKAFLQMLEALRALRVIKRVEVVETSQGKSTDGGSRKDEKQEVSSREMANQYRDLVD